MTQNPKLPKGPQKVSRKPARKCYEPPRAHKKRIRKLESSLPSSQDVKTNLERLEQILKAGKKVQTCEAVAAKLSALANLSNGHVWSWNYIASVGAGAIMPGKKFLRALSLYLGHFKPQQKKWFYFVRRRSVLAVFEKSILVEIIRNQLSQIGYKPVPHVRYMEIRRAATRGRGHHG